MTEPLVSTEWLATHLADENLITLDASYHLPDSGRDAYQEYITAHIPGAVFMDMTRLRDSDNPLPSMMPNADQFYSHVSALGVGNKSHIILYDDAPHVTSARAWFILRHHGINNVSILDGGLPKWRNEGRVLEKGMLHKPEQPLSRKPSLPDIRSKADVLANIASKAEQLVDARGHARFTGKEPETRPGLASGHIPGALNLPYTKLFTADGTWKRGDALRAAFEHAGIDLSRPMVTSCGSGITASVLLFGAHLLGKNDIALYDGSWTEWGADPSTPKATGPA